jgi:hypothetical protein
MNAAATRANLLLAGFSFMLLASAARDANARQIVSSLAPSQTISTVAGGDSCEPIATPDGRFFFWFF